MSGGSQNEGLTVLGFYNPPKSGGANAHLSSVVVSVADIRERIKSEYFCIIVTKNKKEEDRRWFIFSPAQYSEYSKPRVSDIGTDKISVTGAADILAKADKSGYYEKSGVFSLKDVEEHLGRYFTANFYVDKKNDTKMYVFLKKGNAEKYKKPWSKEQGNAGESQQGGAAGAAASGSSGTRPVF